MKLLHLLAFALVSSTPFAVPAQTPVPTPRPTPWAVGSPEIQVNVETFVDQKLPVVAMGADNGFVVAWRDKEGDGSYYGVIARRFDKSGAPLSDDFQVNTTTTGYQFGASIASDSTGNFVVVWTSLPSLQEGPNVFGRRFDANGNPLGPEFPLSSYTSGEQQSPAVAMSDNGFVVVWTRSPAQGGSGSDVFGQRYDADGVPSGGEFQVNTYGLGAQSAADVSMGPAGDFVVVWTSDGQDGDAAGIFGQRFDSSGNPLGGELAVNTETLGIQTSPSVAIGTAGDFVVTWRSQAGYGVPAAIVARLFGLNPPGREFQVSAESSTPKGAPAVARDLSFPGGFVVTWTSYMGPGPGQDSNIVAQRFRNAPFATAAFFLPNAPRQGAEYQINTYTTYGQSSPDIAIGTNGRFVIVWDSYGQDGSGTGVFARHFNFPQGMPMKVDGRASGGASNVNGVLESGERVTVDPAWTNPDPATAPLPLAGSAASLTGPPGPSYTLHDAAADYGTIQPGGTNDCFTATGDCLEVEVSGARPAFHWDATFDETLASDGPLGPVQPATKTWALHVGGSFPDVPQDAFYPYIENLFHNGVTAGGGCGGGQYCGEDNVLRQQMAVFLVKAAYGGAFVPPPATGMAFLDVPASSPFAPWIEELYRLGVVAGCGGSNYCPENPVMRQQMAVFLLKTLYGSGFGGSICTGIFADVDCVTNPFAPFIEYLFNQGITAGCQTSPPLYCPTDPVKRKQMAVFLVKTYGLQLYGPD